MAKEDQLKSRIKESLIATVVAFPIVFGMFHLFIFSLWAYWDIAPEIPLIISSSILMICYWRMEYFVPFPLHNRNSKKTTLLHKAIEIPFWYLIMFVLYAHLSVEFNLGENLKDEGLYIPLLWGYAAFFAVSFIYAAFRGVILSKICDFLQKARRITALFDRVFSIFSLYFFVAVVFSAIYRLLNYLHPGSFNIPIESWFDSLYFSIVTITTLGYGEVHPTHFASKLFVVTEVMLGLLLLVVMLGAAISISFHEAGDKNQEAEHNKQVNKDASR